MTYQVQFLRELKAHGFLEIVMRQETKRDFTLYYHDIFEYPLTDEEVTVWQPGKKLGGELKKRVETEKKGGYSFLKGKGRLVEERRERESISKRKIEMAKRGVGFISTIPTVKMVALTGALAMSNAKVDSDIDIFIICKGGTLWATRMFTIFLLDIFGIPRNAGGKVDKDKLCLNMWLDERDLIWGRTDRNFYTAHEIAQIIPLVNKRGTYERFIFVNRWIKDYWPNAVKILSEEDTKILVGKSKKNHLISKYLSILVS